MDTSPFSFVQGSAPRFVMRFRVSNATHFVPASRAATRSTPSRAPTATSRRRRTFRSTSIVKRRPA